VEPFAIFKLASAAQFMFAEIVVVLFTVTAAPPVILKKLCTGPVYIKPDSATLPDDEIVKAWPLPSVLHEKLPVREIVVATSEGVVVPGMQYWFFAEESVVHDVAVSGVCPNETP
jgi:hypothetical protein